jgi:L-lysine 2,3-aminomutase
VIPHRQIATLDSDWKAQLRDAVTSPTELLSLLGLDESSVGATLQACHDFPLLVPRSFISRMQPGDPSDPLLRQVLPVGAELLAEPGYSEDPVGETGTANTHPGIIQKYQGRVLLILAGGCAVNCRYCFRRHFPYGDNQNSSGEWLQALDTISQDDTISEVILSGGDPLLVSDRQLAELIDQIATIPHVRRLRVHTRLPIVIPQRVTQGLLDALTQTRLKTAVVIHSNHGKEINEEVKVAMKALRDNGIALLNQAVLLAGVNDSPEALADLSEKLFDAGVLPYYLHLLDKVRGAAHFDVDEQRAVELHRAITALLPGYLVPKLVREDAGASSKTMIA